MDHTCKHDVEITELKKAIYGNGQPGLKDTVIRIEERLNSLNENTKGLTTAISGILKFQSEVNGMGKSKKMVQWLIGTSLALFSITLTLLITIFLKP